MRPLLLLLLLALAAARATPADYADIHALFTKHCLDCHSASDPDGKLILESHSSLLRGGETGPALLPNNSAASLLYKMCAGTHTNAGKRLIMPPGKRAKLQPAELALLRAWIDAGALPSTNIATLARTLVTPRIPPTAPVRRSIQSLAWSPKLKLLAVARHGEIELHSPAAKKITRTLTGLRGQVNALAFAADGRTLAAAAGEPALAGQATIWRASDGKLLRTIDAHRDALHAIAISPDGRTLATGGYDSQIKLWDLRTGRELHTLTAHNGCIYALAFRADGKILASASADRTVKLWHTATGKRADTLSQPLKEVFAVAWTPDGARLLAGGADNRIRAWAISTNAAETTNPLLLSKFAHEGAILNLLFSPDGQSVLSAADDGTVKLFSAADLTELHALPVQPDLAPALAFLGAAQIAVGRADGALEIFQLGKKMVGGR